MADTAHDVCELWAHEQDKATLGLSPKEFCAVEENVHPFVDAVLSAKREAGATVGARMGLSHGSP